MKTFDSIVLRYVIIVHCYLNVIFINKVTINKVTCFLTYITLHF